MDFVSDALFTGNKFRALKLVDNFTRELLVIEEGHVVNMLNAICYAGVKAQLGIHVDHGREFVSLALDNGLR